MTTSRTLFYGWRITWTLALTQTVGYGVLYYAFSVLVKPMEGELGWTRAQTSLAFSLALLVQGLLAHSVGRYVDKHGARAVMTFGSSLGSLCVLAWSQVTTLSMLYVVWLGVGVASAMVLYPVAFTVIAVWFRRLRPKAMLVVTLTAGLASTIFLPLCTYLVATLGWREALIVLAFLLALTTIPTHAFVLRRYPKDLGLEPDGEPQNQSGQTKEVSHHAATRSATFWWLTLAFALSSLTSVAIAAHLVPMLLERNYPSSLVAVVAGSVGLMQLAGRIFYTPLSQRFSLVKVSALFASLHGLALCCLLLVPGLVGLWLFAFLFGIANGSLSLAKAALVVETYGAMNYGSISGSMTTFTAIATTFAPFGAGALHDLTRGYESVLWSLLGASLLAAVAIMQATNVSISVSDTEQVDSP